MSMIKNIDLIINTVELHAWHDDFGRKRSYHEESTGNLQHEEELEEASY